MHQKQRMQLEFESRESKQAGVGQKFKIYGQTALKCRGCKKNPQISFNGILMA